MAEDRVGLTYAVRDAATAQLMAVRQEMHALRQEMAQMTGDAPEFNQAQRSMQASMQGGQKSAGGLGGSLVSMAGRLTTGAALAGGAAYAVGRLGRGMFEAQEAAASWERPFMKAERAVGATASSSEQAAAQFGHMEGRIDEVADKAGMLESDVAGAAGELTLRLGDGADAAANLERAIGLMAVTGDDASSASKDLSEALDGDIQAMKELGILSDSQVQEFMQLGSRSEATAAAMEVLDQKIAGAIETKKDSQSQAERLGNAWTKLTAQFGATAPIEGATSLIAGAVEGIADGVEEYNDTWETSAGSITEAMQRVEDKTRDVEQAQKDAEEATRDFQDAFLEGGEVADLISASREYEAELERINERQAEIEAFRQQSGDWDYGADEMRELNIQANEARETLARQRQTAVDPAETERELRQLQLEKQIKEATSEAEREHLESMQERGQIHTEINERVDDINAQYKQIAENDGIAADAKDEQLAALRDESDRLERIRTLRLEMIGLEEQDTDDTGDGGPTPDELERRNRIAQKRQQIVSADSERRQARLEAEKEMIALKGRDLTEEEEWAELLEIQAERREKLKKIRAEEDEAAADERRGEFRDEAAQKRMEALQAEDAIRRAELTHAAERAEIRAQDLDAQDQRLALLESERQMNRQIAEIEQKRLEERLEGQAATAEVITGAFDQTSTMRQEALEEETDALREAQKATDSEARKEELEAEIKSIEQMHDLRGALGGLTGDIQGTTAELQTLHEEGASAGEMWQAGLQGAGSATTSFLQQMGVDYEWLAGIRATFETASSIAAFATGNIPKGAAHAAAAGIFGSLAVTGAGAGKGAKGAGKGEGVEGQDIEPMDLNQAFETAKRAYLEALLEARQESRERTVIIDQSGSQFFERNHASVRQASRTLEDSERYRVGAAA